ncbi:response regulator [Xanthobacter sp. KR7-65]|uniref:hybrid sensor histidine kinase/response regulator n=1 Tax=Xanthobacter sp. KR7-65 TaxID=3156612 RepID=UPI0032B57E11
MNANAPIPSNWLKLGGECGELIAAHDWSATSLGPIDTWNEHFRSTVSAIVNSPIPKVLMWGPDHVMIYNDGYSVIAGGNHPRALGGTVEGIWPEIWDFNRRIIENGMRGEIQSYRDQSMTLRRSGAPEEVFFDLFYTPIPTADDVIGGVLCTVLEITQRVHMERELIASNKRFAAAMAAVRGVLWTNSADGEMAGPQPGWEALTGQSFAEYQGYGWSKAVHPEDAQPTVEAWQRAVADRDIFVFEHRVRRRDGEWRHFAIRAVPILSDAGNITEWVGVHTDITDQRDAEEALRDRARELEQEVHNRELAEDKLRALNEHLESRVATAIEERRQAELALAQSKKLETIGQLTGGVAHDFNNLLQVVSGNLQLLARDVAGNERAERRVGNAMAGVARGSKLAAQLLAFGRRQALEPKVVNVTRFVRGMDEMLRRAIGEGIEIETVAAGGLWNTFIDPAQIENALLNLAINARDAMNGQGKLTIELGNATLDDAYARVHPEVLPGQYVMLAVTDTGSGIDASIVDKVFEPFFSTKAEGKGSGLGLSMVYGFVKQSGGHVKVYSELGHGTTIRLYLPRAMASEDVEVATTAQDVAGGPETILVVEDDEEVRNTVVEMLGDLGYRVLKAVDAQSGLSVVESGISIDLLFTDVVMPGPMKSTELARRAKERLPNIAVLFTSGYTENSIVHGGRLDSGVDLLSKPYTREALARKVRHVISNEKQRIQAAERAAQAEALPDPVPPAPEPGPSRSVLLVEDDLLIRMSAADMLREAGCTVLEAADAEAALAIAGSTPIDVLMTDINLPRLSGHALAEQVRALQPNVQLIFATGEGGPEIPSDARLLRKPYVFRDLLAALGPAPESE